jgi:nucleotide-binding universal stress UspA family protein
MFKTILVPIEMAHVAESEAVVNLAKQQSADGAKIILLNVVEEIPTWAASAIPADIIERSKETSRKQLEALADSSGPSVEARIRSGHAYNTILDEAESSGADLIIIQSHRPGLQDYLLGSTAAKVVRHATCSVLVLR